MKTQTNNGAEIDLETESHEAAVIQHFGMRRNADVPTEPYSHSLDVFESWEQFCRVKIIGYTLRDGTDVCRFNFPSGILDTPTIDHMAQLINRGWQITAIHYENGQPPAVAITRSSNNP